MDDDGPAPDDGVFADGNKRKDAHIDADLAAPSQERPAHTFSRQLASRVEVIGDRRPRGDKDIIFDDRILRNVDIAVDLDIVADPASIIQDGIGPDAKVVSNQVFLADDDVVAGLEIMAYGRPGIDYGVAADDRIVADGERVIIQLPGGQVTEKNAIVDLRVAPQTKGLGLRVRPSHHGVHSEDFKSLLADCSAQPAGCRVYAGSLGSLLSTAQSRA